MKKTDLAYIAGIIDGEGCISIGQRKCKDSSIIKQGIADLGRHKL